MDKPTRSLNRLLWGLSSNYWTNNLQRRLSEDEKHLEHEINWGGRKVQLVRIRHARGGPELVFPFEKTGLHIAFHPGMKPHLREGNRPGNQKGAILAEMDTESIKSLTEDDAKSMFHYPTHFREIIMIPVDLSDMEDIGARLSDPPHLYELLLKKRTIFVIKGRRIREFVKENSGEYVIIDNDSISLYGPTLEVLGPLNFERRPKNRKLAKLFELRNALMKRIESLSESELNLPKPTDTEISEWGARIELVASETRVYRWKRETGAREQQVTSRKMPER